MGGSRKGRNLPVTQEIWEEFEKRILNIEEQINGLTGAISDPRLRAARKTIGLYFSVKYVDKLMKAGNILESVRINLQWNTEDRLDGRKPNGDNGNVGR